MKKLSILSAVFAVTAIVLLAVCMDGNAQSSSKVEKIIRENGEKFTRWFNTGQIDSLMTLYSDDACLVAMGCGRAFIRDYYESQSQFLKFEEFSILSINVGGSVAVEKGRWVVSLSSGGKLTGEYLTEWHKIDKKWLIVNDISNND